jgi:hypothetical protein
MSEDIVTRLRSDKWPEDMSLMILQLGRLVIEAADEIERLRAKLDKATIPANVDTIQECDRLRAEIERLRDIIRDEMGYAAEDVGVPMKVAP